MACVLHIIAAYFLYTLSYAAALVAVPFPVHLFLWYPLWAAYAGLVLASLFLFLAFRKTKPGLASFFITVFIVGVPLLLIFLLRYTPYAFASCC